MKHKTWVIPLSGISPLYKESLCAEESRTVQVIYRCGEWVVHRPIPTDYRKFLVSHAYIGKACELHFDNRKDAIALCKALGRISPQFYSIQDPAYRMTASQCRRIVWSAYEDGKGEYA